MSDTTATEAQGADGAQGDGDQQQEQQKMVPQSEVDKIVRERVARERAKFADYDDVKAKAGNAQTLEQQLTDLQKAFSATQAEALRTRVAAKFGISTTPGEDGEPSDADLFLTGSDESILTAQAQRLAAREADRKLHGNVASKEGTTSTTSTATSPTREWLRTLNEKD